MPKNQFDTYEEAVAAAIAEQGNTDLLDCCDLVANPDDLVRQQCDQEPKFVCAYNMHTEIFAIS
jgi:hypothetical protein